MSKLCVVFNKIVEYISSCQSIVFLLRWNIQWPCQWITIWNPIIKRINYFAKAFIVIRPYSSINIASSDSYILFVIYVIKVPKSRRGLSGEVGKSIKEYSDPRSEWAFYIYYGVWTKSFTAAVNANTMRGFALFCFYGIMNKLSCYLNQPRSTSSQIHPSCMLYHVRTTGL